MRNITVSVDDETYRRARIRAAELDTSVSRVVKDTLVSFAAEPSDAESRAATLRELYAKVDARLSKVKGKSDPAVYPGWRDDYYDERFDNSVLGRSLRERGE